MKSSTKYISNYVISDFDCTFFNFAEVDRKVITDIFGNHKIVLLLDRILWRVNSLGIFGNSMRALKLRFLAYSILTIFSGYIKYSYIYDRYEKLYKEYAQKKYNRKKWIVRKITQRGYYFAILTNNKFASEIKADYIIYVKSKRRYLKRHIPEILIGDNLWDDYRNCPKQTRYINVGGGIISKLKLKNIDCIKNIYDIFKVL